MWPLHTEIAQYVAVFNIAQLLKQQVIVGSVIAVGTVIAGCLRRAYWQTARNKSGRTTKCIHFEPESSAIAGKPVSLLACRALICVFDKT